MMLMSLIPFLLFLMITVYAGENDNLLAVVQIFRHGQRTPLYFYPNEPYNDKDEYWDGLDFSQLTKEGRRQHHALGEFSRKRYSDWLSRTYNRNDIHVESTNIDRTIMSAQSNLYGLYPATEEEKWLDHTDWQAIPVHSSDPRMIASLPSCPRYSMLRLDVSKTEEYQQLDAESASMYEYLTNYTGEKITNFNEAFNIYDTLETEHECGLSLPDWTSSVYPEPITTTAVKWFQSLSYTTEMQRLFVGPLLNEIFNSFEKMIQDPTTTPRYKIYSGHDTNVFSILDTFGHPPNSPVPFAGSLYLELRKIDSNNVVNVWYKAKDNFTEVKIKSCDLDCPLEEVETLLSDVLIDINTRERECDMASS